MLMFLYPLAITLILLALFGKFFAHDKIVYACVTGFTCFAALFDFMKTLPTPLQTSLEPVIAFGSKILPFFSLNFGWVVPALIGLALGLLLHNRRKQSA